MGNFFSSIKNSMNNNSKLSWGQVIMMSLIPLGQLYARVKIFNGSLDKWWLMFPLLLFPPLSFIPLIMMKFGMIKDGKGSSPIDNFMIIPIIAKLVIPFILPFIIDEDSTILYTIVSFILQLITAMIANLIRRKNNCKEITTNSIGKAGIDSTIAIAMGEVASYAISFIPFIGMFISILENLPFIGKFVDSLIWSIGFAGTYIIINMFNQDDMGKFCSTPFIGNTQDKIPFIGSLFVLIGVNVLRSL